VLAGRCGARWSALWGSRSGQCEVDYWCHFLVAAWGLRDTAELRLSSVMSLWDGTWSISSIQGNTAGNPPHTVRSGSLAERTPEMLGSSPWQRVCLLFYSFVPIGPDLVTSIGPGRKKWKKKNLQRGFLGQHRHVFSVLEFYSLQGVLWGFVTVYCTCRKSSITHKGTGKIINRSCSLVLTFEHWLNCILKCLSFCYRRDNIHGTNCYKHHVS